MEKLSYFMDYHKIITIEPGKRSGKPCIRGMRITVYDILEYLAGRMTEKGKPTPPIFVGFPCVNPTYRL